MSSIKHYIANSTGELNKWVDMIQQSLKKVIPIVEQDLKANQIDIIFISAPSLAIPEYGIGGNSPGPHYLYVSFDPTSRNITLAGIEETLFHEIHHCMRRRDPGYGKTLGEAMVSEGLACLYEEEHSGKVPIYAQLNLKAKHIEKAKRLLNTKGYNHSEWFFGDKEIDRWFGYSYGYKVCRDYSLKVGQKASELVSIPADNVLQNVL